MQIMEFASRLRWILVIIFVVLALIIVSWGLYSIARSIFNDATGGSDSQEFVEADTVVSSAATARYIVDGPVVANKDHRSYEIEVSENVVSMTVYKSYGSSVIDSESYKNTSASYSAFLSSLENMGVTDRHKNTDLDDDYTEEGVCPTGKRLILELDSDLRRWNTTCSSKQGTAAFSMSSVGSLFKKQVPDYSDLVSGTGL